MVLLERFWPQNSVAGEHIIIGQEERAGSGAGPSVRSHVLSYLLVTKAIWCLWWVKGGGTESYHLTVILLSKRLLDRETVCGKNGRAGIFSLPWTPVRATWSGPVISVTCLLLPRLRVSITLQSINHSDLGTVL